MPIFAAKKRRKGLDMMYLAIIFAGCAIGLIVGLMNPESEKPKKPWKPKKKNWWLRDHHWKGPVGTPPDLL